MRIVYIANHDSGGNDDEGAITHALTSLGHEVQRVREVKGNRAVNLDGDMLLFHKWCDPVALQRFRGRMPRVFWYFDLVDWPDATLAGRNVGRLQWMEQVMPHVERGYCTDGDWAKRHPGKLRMLRQGADGRIVGRAAWTECCPLCEQPHKGFDLLFTGTPKGGVRRQQFVVEMQKRWGSSFKHVASGLHRERLASVISGTRIVVAPPSPVTDLYWSNRVYNALGFGAFLLHPRCKGIEEEYSDLRDIVCYDSMQDLHGKIERFLTEPILRAEIGTSGLKRTRMEHCYVHRCARLVREIIDDFHGGKDPSDGRTDQRPPVLEEPPGAGEAGPEASPGRVPLPP